MKNCIYAYTPFGRTCISTLSSFQPADHDFASGMSLSTKFSNSSFCLSEIMVSWFCWTYTYGPEHPKGPLHTVLLYTGGDMSSQAVTFGGIRDVMRGAQPIDGWM